jgi:hypothetical protein
VAADAAAGEGGGVLAGGNGAVARRFGRISSSLGFPFRPFYFLFLPFGFPFLPLRRSNIKGLSAIGFLFRSRGNFRGRGDHLIASKQTVPAALNPASGLLRRAGNEGYNPGEQPTRILAIRLRVNVLLRQSYPTTA